MIKKTFHFEAIVGNIKVWWDTEDSTFSIWELEDARWELKHGLIRQDNMQDLRDALNELLVEKSKIVEE
jgi:chromatin segregation and condensation protein Rec8/ScpA/Scc1 (kleisin family)